MIVPFLKKLKIIAVVLVQVFFSFRGYAKENISFIKAGSLQFNQDTTVKKDTTVKEKDIIDILHSFRKSPTKAARPPKQFNFSLVPSAGYTLSTGFAVDLSGNAVFYTNPADKEKLSNVFSNVTYDQHNQFLFHTNSTIWSKSENYVFIGDWRLLKYPENTFGLGSLTNSSTQNLVDYDYVRFYQTVLRKIFTNFYSGFGYNLDYHFNIAEAGNADHSVSDYKNYGLNPTTVSSGITYNLLYDSRKNPVNPINGIYSNIIYRSNLRFLGSDENWQSLTLDFRKYFKLSPKNDNVFALWMLDWVTLNGQPPYLDLPSTGWDTNGNSGRGYPQGRFRGKSMLYLEGEYRFNITQNHLLGGVLFANAESFSAYPGNQFQKILPGYGPGVRIKFNKQSHTNLCIDYGIGQHSQGFFVNLGEVF